MHDWLEKVLKEQYQFITGSKNPKKSEIVILVHKTLHKRIVKRVFTGQSEVYRKLLTLKHKNMPEILEVSEFEDKVLVLEEYIDGVTLLDLINENLYRENQVKKFMGELCDVLSFLHSFNIIHRDIKPENIMIENGTQTLKLIDFDSARVYKKYYTKDTEYLGTQGYAAPEQYGDTQTDIRTDIYAIGIMMNVMLTGKPPTIQLYNGRLSRIIEKCIQVSPDKRFQTAEELKRSLK
ncbi:MAG: serine/threonine protein kinase [Clostridium sp.]|nr:serine/threonine protein kinase [Clostridium sp.]